MIHAEHDKGTKLMAEKNQIDRAFERSKEQGEILGIQVSSGSLYAGVVERMDNEVLMVRDKKGRKTLVARPCVVAVYVAGGGDTSWEE